MPGKLRQNDTLNATELYCSLLFGRGLYRWDGQTTPDPMGETDAGGVSPLLANVFTGELFYAKRLECDPQKLTSVRNQVLSLPKGHVALWPTDLVSLPQDGSDALTLYMDNQYTESPKEPAERGGSWAVLFPFETHPDAVRFETVYRQMEEPTWKNPDLRSLAIRIVVAIDRLNRFGYIYNDFHLSRFFVRTDGSVFLDYSMLLYDALDLSSQESNVLCAPKAGKYPLEFMEPSYVQGKLGHLDFAAQNYQLCALLFFLLMGRYAYDGRLLVGETDDSAIRHYEKFRTYHKMPVFMFDELDTRNALGIFAEDEDCIQLWNSLPEALRTLFTYTLRQENALRIGGAINPAPSTWLREFAELGWLDGIGDLEGEFA